MITGGTITKKELTKDGTGPKGPWARWVFTIDNKRWSTLDPKIYQPFNVGDVVEIETKTEGKYENMISMKKQVIETANPEKAAVKPSNNGFHLTDEACRSNALTNAISWADYTHLEVNAEQILVLAEQFYDYIKNGRKK